MEPGSICSWFLKYNLKTNWNFKNSDKKYRAYISTFYILMKPFHGKATFYAAGMKKTNFGGTIRLFTRYFFLSFLLSTHKMSVFHETLCSHIKYCDLCMKFFVMIFLHFKMCF